MEGFEGGAASVERLNKCINVGGSPGTRAAQRQQAEEEREEDEEEEEAVLQRQPSAGS